MAPLVRKPLYKLLMNKLRSSIEQERPHLLASENDLIRQYGVSRNTVRRAIQELTAEGLLQPVQGLGTLVYPVPKIRDSSTILVLVDRDWQQFERDAFERLLPKLDECKLHVMLLMINLSWPDMERIELLLNRVDGVIVNWKVGQSEAITELLHKHRKKVICLRGYSVDNSLNYVVDDLENGMYQMTRYLLELGHRRIAFLIDLEDSLRMNGIRRALEEAHATLDPALCMQCKGLRRSAGFLAASKLLEAGKPFTAIVAQNDILALGIMEQLLISGFRIPEDISLVGYDDLSESAEYPVPLTTCGHILDQLVNKALEFLLNNETQSCHLVLRPELVIRQSTGKLSEQPKKQLFFEMKKMT